MYNYIGPITYTIFLSIPFFLLCDFAFNILQLPFALIHRYAARAVFLYKIYILCQFFAILARVYIQKFTLNPVAFLLVYSVILFFSFSGAMHDAEENDHQNGTRNAPFVATTAFFSIPALWVIYFLDISVLNQPAMWFFKLIKLLLDVPVIGDILTFFLNLSSGAAVIFFAILILVFLMVIAAKVTNILHSRGGNSAEENNS